MNPVKFEGVNVQFADEQPEYNALPALHRKDENGTVVTAWQLSDEELEQLRKTKTIYLQVLTFYKPLQPVFLTVDPTEVGLIVVTEEPVTPINPEDDAA